MQNVHFTEAQFSWVPGYLEKLHVCKLSLKWTRLAAGLSYLYLALPPGPSPTRQHLGSVSLETLSALPLLMLPLLLLLLHYSTSTGLDILWV